MQLELNFIQYKQKNKLENNEMPLGFFLKNGENYFIHYVGDYIYFLSKCHKFSFSPLEVFCGFHYLIKSDIINRLNEFSNIKKEEISLFEKNFISPTNASVFLYIEGNCFGRTMFSEFILYYYPNIDENDIKGYYV
jgi:hypothetical protein